MLRGKWFALGLAVAVLSVFVWLAGVKFKEDHDRTERYRERIRRLREQFPFESLETRLPPPPHFKGDHSLSQKAEELLRQFENSISNPTENWGREAKLKKLHEGSVEEFVKREGFGVGRMFGSSAESVFALGHQKDDGTWVGRNKTSIPQASRTHSLSSQEVDLAPERVPVDFTTFQTLHFRNILHFANPGGFGVMDARRNVAGFQAHQFNELLEEKHWNINRLELVGLLLEDGPRVYVTTTLPRMQEIRGVPTRSLDAFEVPGLKKLHGGDDLFLRDMADGVRMLGAIRNASQCVKCHDSKRGALLGAFSYSLSHEP